MGAGRVGGDEEHQSAALDIARTIPPEIHGFRRGEGMHEADGSSAFDAINQHRGQLLDVGI